MPRSTRRDVLGGVAASALIGTTRAYGFDPAKGPVVNAPSQVPGTPTSLELQVLQTLADGVLEDFALPALSVCVAFEGKILYEHAIGSAVLANPALGTPQMAATPSTLFRVASVSKPITSVTVMNMVQLGLLRLDDRVFGPSGLLQMRFGGVTPVDPRYADITLAHLLTHTSGLPQNDGNDPMFAYPALDAEQLIKKVIETRTLSCAPGTTYRYSNFGYCVLGRVIERTAPVRRADAAGFWMKYDQAVRQRVLAPLNITGMGIAGNTLAARRGTEAAYYDLRGIGADAYGFDVERMDSHGGWLATAGDLARFAWDGPNLLDQAARTTMWTPPDLAAAPIGGCGLPVPPNAAQTPTPLVRYAKGWNTNGGFSDWHNGSLAGTASIMVRTAAGLTFAVLTNARTNDVSRMDADLQTCGIVRFEESIDSAIATLGWRMVAAVASWKRFGPC